MDDGLEIECDFNKVGHTLATVARVCDIAASRGKKLMAVEVDAFAEQDAKRRNRIILMVRVRLCHRHLTTKTQGDAV